MIEGDFQGRMDLRNWTVVTIDGEDAKDLDDGISLTTLLFVLFSNIAIASL